MIQGDKVQLRLLREHDLDGFFEAMTDLGARGSYFPLNLIGEPRLRREFEKTGFWDNDDGTLLIVDSEGSTVGEIEFFPIIAYLQGYEISYLIFDANSRGKGYAAEAVSLLVTYLFGRRPVNRLQLNIHPDNEASRRVARKCGFSLEGVMRECWFHQGRYHDLEVWSILRGEASGLPVPNDSAGRGTP